MAYALEAATPYVPAILLARASRWSGLARPERRDLARELRRLGLSYREIGQLIPVGRASLSEWCRDVELSGEQRARLRALRPPEEIRRELGRRKRDEALARAAETRAAAREEARALATDPEWLAGVVAYWSAGAKKTGAVELTSADPALIRLFVQWCARWLGHAEFTAHLQVTDEGSTEELTRRWAEETGLPLDAFRKPVLKPRRQPPGRSTGVVRVRLRRSSALLPKVQGWIDAIAARAVVAGSPTRRRGA